MGRAQRFLPVVKCWPDCRVAVIGPGHDEIDIGFFISKGCHVTSFDLVNHRCQSGSHHSVQLGDFCQADNEHAGKFDVVWACHVLEHQRNVGHFLDKVRSLLHDDGVLYISVPPAKNNIVGGHVSIWNIGLLTYNLCLAGFDMRTASFKRDGYNLFGVCKKLQMPLPKLIQDKGDLELLSDYWSPDFKLVQNVDGNRSEVNWPPTV